MVVNLLGYFLNLAINFFLNLCHKINYTEQYNLYLYNRATTETNVGFCVLDFDDMEHMVIILI